MPTYLRTWVPAYLYTYYLYIYIYVYVYIPTYIRPYILTDLHTSMLSYLQVLYCIFQRYIQYYTVLRLERNNMPHFNIIGMYLIGIVWCWAYRKATTRVCLCRSLICWIVGAKVPKRQSHCHSLMTLSVVFCIWRSGNSLLDFFPAARPSCFLASSCIRG